MTPQERAQELADAHWGYIHALIMTHGMEKDDAEIIGFHYRTAFAHGYKHATEDARETARAAFTPVQEEYGNLDGLMPREYPFAFPPALKWMGKSALDYVTKLREEVKEVADATRIEDAVEEMFDVIHTAETGIRTCCEYAGLDAGVIRDAVERKNRIRGYYEPQG